MLAFQDSCFPLTAEWARHSRRNAGHDIRYDSEAEPNTKAPREKFASFRVANMCGPVSASRVMLTHHSFRTGGSEHFAEAKDTSASTANRFLSSVILRANKE